MEYSSHSAVNRKKRDDAAASVVSVSKDLFNTRMSVIPEAIFSMSRFKGKLGAAIGIITCMTVGFLTLPNNILYLIDNQHHTRIMDKLSSLEIATEPGTHRITDHEYAYIYGGVFLIFTGMLCLVFSMVLSFFAAKSKTKMDTYTRPSTAHTKSTRTVLACLTILNVELFMSIIAGCMEFLYRPLTKDAWRLHSVECAVAVLNIIIYILYVGTIILTTIVLKEKHKLNHQQEHLVEAVSVSPVKKNTYGPTSRYF